ncbi:MmgE/PrpD family protein [Thalassotalea maritima]|uniref:MmgE/PrpD family protein n=1 Tax=Thalassotalea maritima TaxID=3242416 RepID=UPI00352821E7
MPTHDDNHTQSLTEQLIFETYRKPVSDDDLHRSAQHVLDFLGCAAAAMNSDAANSYRQLLNDSISGPVSAVFCGRYELQAGLSFNAAIGNVLEMDDIHRSSTLHPGPVIIPAALAVAQWQKASMSDFLVAIIKGYELTIRLGQSIGRSHYQYFHNTSTCASLGAAYSAALLLKLSPAQCVAAVGNAGSRTGGVWQMRHESVMTKQWHNSEAAKSGVNAAVMARYGVTGPAFILEGEQGLFQAMSHDADTTMFMRSYAHWLIHEVSFKPWPACRHAHPAIDVCQQVLRQLKHQGQSVNALDIEAIDIDTYQDAITFCDRRIIECETHAKFSIQHAIAALILCGEPALAHYQQAIYDDPRIIALREKVRVGLSVNIESDYPNHYGARCQIRLLDGTSCQAYSKDTLGDPERPLTSHQLTNKALMLLAHGKVDVQTARRLASLDWYQHRDLTALTGLLEPSDES